MVLVLFLTAGFFIWRKCQFVGPPVGDVLIQTDKAEYRPGDVLKLKIKNNLGENISFSSCYPYYLERMNEQWESYKYTKCHELNGNEYYITTGEEKAFEIILPEILDGLHRLAIPVCIGCDNVDFFRNDKIFYSNEFFIK